MTAPVSIRHSPIFGSPESNGSVQLGQGFSGPGPAEPGDVVSWWPTGVPPQIYAYLGGGLWPAASEGRSQQVAAALLSTYRSLVGARETAGHGAQQLDSSILSMSMAEFTKHFSSAEGGVDPATLEVAHQYRDLARTTLDFADSIRYAKWSFNIQNAFVVLEWLTAVGFAVATSGASLGEFFLVLLPIGRLRCLRIAAEVLEEIFFSGAPAAVTEFISHPGRIDWGSINFNSFAGGLGGGVGGVFGNATAFLAKLPAGSLGRLFAQFSGTLPGQAFTMTGINAAANAGAWAAAGSFGQDAGDLGQSILATLQSGPASGLMFGLPSLIGRHRHLMQISDHLQAAVTPGESTMRLFDTEGWSVGTVTVNPDGQSLTVNYNTIAQLFGSKPHTDTITLPGTDLYGSRDNAQLRFSTAGGVVTVVSATRETNGLLPVWTSGGTQSAPAGSLLTYDGAGQLQYAQIRTANGFQLFHQSPDGWAQFGSTTFANDQLTVLDAHGGRVAVLDPDTLHVARPELTPATITHTSQGVVLSQPGTDGSAATYVLRYDGGVEFARTSLAETAPGTTTAPPAALVPLAMPPDSARPAWRAWESRDGTQLALAPAFLAQPPAIPVPAGPGAGLRVSVHGGTRPMVAARSGDSAADASALTTTLLSLPRVREAIRAGHTIVLDSVAGGIAANEAGAVATELADRLTTWAAANGIQGPVRVDVALGDVVGDTVVVRSRGGQLMSLPSEHARATLTGVARPHGSPAAEASGSDTAQLPRPAPLAVPPRAIDWAGVAVILRRQGVGSGTPVDPALLAEATTWQAQASDFVEALREISWPDRAAEEAVRATIAEYAVVAGEVQRQLAEWAAGDRAEVSRGAVLAAALDTLAATRPLAARLVLAARDARDAAAVQAPVAQLVEAVRQVQVYTTAWRHEPDLVIGARARIAAAQALAAQPPTAAGTDELHALHSELRSAANDLAGVLDRELARAQPRPAQLLQVRAGTVALEQLAYAYQGISDSAADRALTSVYRLIGQRAGRAIAEVLDLLGARPRPKVDAVIRGEAPPVRGPELRSEVAAARNLAERALTALKPLADQGQPAEALRTEVSLTLHRYAAVLAQLVSDLAVRPELSAKQATAVRVARLELAGLVESLRTIDQNALARAAVRESLVRLDEYAPWLEPARPGAAIAQAHQAARRALGWFENLAVLRPPADPAERSQFDAMVTAVRDLADASGSLTVQVDRLLSGDRTAVAWADDLTRAMEVARAAQRWLSDAIDASRVTDPLVRDGQIRHLTANIGLAAQKLAATSLGAAVTAEEARRWQLPALRGRDIALAAWLRLDPDDRIIVADRTSTDAAGLLWQAPDPATHRGYLTVVAHGDHTGRLRLGAERLDGVHLAKLLLQVPAFRNGVLAGRPVLLEACWAAVGEARSVARQLADTLTAWAAAVGSPGLEVRVRAAPGVVEVGTGLTVLRPTPGAAQLQPATDAWIDFWGKPAPGLPTDWFASPTAGPADDTRLLPEIAAGLPPEREASPWSRRPRHTAQWGSPLRSGDSNAVPGPSDDPVRILAHSAQWLADALVQSLPKPGEVEVGAGQDLSTVLPAVEAVALWARSADPAVLGSPEQVWSLAAASGLIAFVHNELNTYDPAQGEYWFHPRAVAQALDHVLASLKGDMMTGPSAGPKVPLLGLVSTAASIAMMGAAIVDLDEAARPQEIEDTRAVRKRVGKQLASFATEAMTLIGLLNDVLWARAIGTGRLYDLMRDLRPASQLEQVAVVVGHLAMPIALLRATETQQLTWGGQKLVAIADQLEGIVEALATSLGTTDGLVIGPMPTVPGYQSLVDLRHEQRLAVEVTQRLALAKVNHLHGLAPDLGVVLADLEAALAAAPDVPANPASAWRVLLDVEMLMRRVVEVTRADRADDAHHDLAQLLVSELGSRARALRRLTAATAAPDAPRTVVRDLPALVSATTATIARLAEVGGIDPAVVERSSLAMDEVRSLLARVGGVGLPVADAQRLARAMQALDATMQTAITWGMPAPAVLSTSALTDLVDASVAADVRDAAAGVSSVVDEARRVIDLRAAIARIEPAAPLWPNVEPAGQPLASGLLVLDSLRDAIEGCDAGRLPFDRLTIQSHLDKLDAALDRFGRQWPAGPGPISPAVRRAMTVATAAAAEFIGFVARGVRLYEQLGAVGSGLEPGAGADALRSFHAAIPGAVAGLDLALDELAGAREAAGWRDEVRAAAVLHELPSGGVHLLGGDSRAEQFVGDIAEHDGVRVVALHATAEGVVINGVVADPVAVGRAVRAKLEEAGWRPGEPVRIAGCAAASWAAQWAQEWQTPVLATTDPVWMYQVDGRTYVVAAPASETGLPANLDGQDFTTFVPPGWSGELPPARPPLPPAGPPARVARDGVLRLGQQQQVNWRPVASDTFAGVPPGRAALAQAVAALGEQPWGSVSAHPERDGVVQVQIKGGQRFELDVRLAHLPEGQQARLRLISHGDQAGPLPRPRPVLEVSHDVHQSLLTQALAQHIAGAVAHLRAGRAVNLARLSQRAKGRLFAQGRRLSAADSGRLAGLNVLARLIGGKPTPAQDDQLVGSLRELNLLSDQPGAGDRRKALKGWLTSRPNHKIIAQRMFDTRAMASPAAALTGLAGAARRYAMYAEELVGVSLPQLSGIDSSASKSERDAAAARLADADQLRLRVECRTTRVGRGSGGFVEVPITFDTAAGRESAVRLEVTAGGYRLLVRPDASDEAIAVQTAGALARIAVHEAAAVRDDAGVSQHELDEADRTARLRMLGAIYRARGTSHTTKQAILHVVRALPAAGGRVVGKSAVVGAAMREATGGTPWWTHALRRITANGASIVNSLVVGAATHRAESKTMNSVLTQGASTAAQIPSDFLAELLRVDSLKVKLYEPGEELKTASVFWPGDKQKFAENVVKRLPMVIAAAVTSTATAFYYQEGIDKSVINGGINVGAGFLQAWLDRIYDRPEKLASARDEYFAAAEPDHLRNKAVQTLRARAEEARGRIIAWCGSDDRPDPKIRQQYAEQLATHLEALRKMRDELSEEVADKIDDLRARRPVTRAARAAWNATVATVAPTTRITNPPRPGGPSHLPAARGLPGYAPPPLANAKRVGGQGLAGSLPSLVNAALGIKNWSSALGDSSFLYASIGSVTGLVYGGSYGLGWTLLHRHLAADRVAVAAFDALVDTNRAIAVLDDLRRVLADPDGYESDLVDAFDPARPPGQVSRRLATPVQLVATTFSQAAVIGRQFWADRRAHRPSTVSVTNLLVYKTGLELVGRVAATASLWSLAMATHLTSLTVDAFRLTVGSAVFVEVFRGLGEAVMRTVPDYLERRFLQWVTRALVHSDPVTPGEHMDRVGDLIATSSRLQEALSQAVAQQRPGQAAVQVPALVEPPEHDHGQRTLAPGPDDWRTMPGPQAPAVGAVGMDWHGFERNTADRAEAKALVYLVRVLESATSAGPRPRALDSTAIKAEIVTLLWRNGLLVPDATPATASEIGAERRWRRLTAYLSLVEPTLSLAHVNDLRRGQAGTDAERAAIAKALAKARRSAPLRDPLTAALDLMEGEVLGWRGTRQRSAVLVGPDLVRLSTWDESEHPDPLFPVGEVDIRVVVRDLPDEVSAWLRFGAAGNRGHEVVLPQRVVDDPRALAATLEFVFDQVLARGRGAQPQPDEVVLSR